ncbi:hypothetical protein ABRG53_a036 (plasmid) [Pseudanabaena sp. ABRG5-3]|nr:hypothetical protein ABRG53_a036 [Pseudanabaena sp. ABRG5-3]
MTTINQGLQPCIIENKAIFREALQLIKKHYNQFIGYSVFSINDQRNKINADLHILSGFQVKPKERTNL